MQEHVNYFKNIQSEYQEYIETWVHEINLISKENEGTEVRIIFPISKTNILSTKVN
jgi:hypothetical protein